MKNELLVETRTYLTFRLGNEVFASDVVHVLNILEVMPITSIPKAPEYVKGVINLRGMVLPVIDTRLKFGMSQTVENGNTAILVLHVKAHGKDIKIGAMVDSVEEVINIDDNQIQPPPAIGGTYKTEFIEGLAQQGTGFIILLNMDRVFSTDEILLQDQF